MFKILSGVYVRVIAVEARTEIIVGLANACLVNSPISQAIFCVAVLTVSN